MRIETYGQQIDVTPALREYVEAKFARLSRHVEQQPFDIRVQLRVERTDHHAEATVNLAGKTLHADASGIDMYAGIDLLADKLDRLLVKHRKKIVDQRRGEATIRTGEVG